MTKTNTYLITGAGRDIGRAIAEELATPESFAIIHCNSSKEGAEETLAMVRAKGGDGAVVLADFTNLDGFEILANSVKELLEGRKLNNLIHNAAFTSASPAGELNLVALDNVLKVNVLTPYLLTDALSPVLADGGSIVAITIAATQKVFSPEFGFFCASKAAVDTLVRNWAIQFAPRRIRANAVAPGVVEVNFRADLLKNAEFRTRLESETAMGRPGTVTDIANVVHFLASNKSGWITGQVIDSSGGWKL
ncbi:MAG: SDR family oxidoreductase [Leptolyngbya sp.]|nr:SDR family oxidoreductase [Candidatus Melainabacteria bacterium]